MEILANNPTTTLNGSINDSTTSVVVTSGASFPASGTFRILIGTEIMKVTSVSGTTFTVQRGSEGTTAASHTNGDTITGVVTKEALENFRSDFIIYGNYSSLPAAGVAGRIYRATDFPIELRDTGAAWVGFRSGHMEFTTPTTSGFSWVNQGSATVDTTNWGLYFSCVTNGNTSDYRHYVKSYTAPFKITVALQTGFQTSNSGGVGLVFRNSSSGKFATLLYWAGGGDTSIEQLGSENYNSPTSFNSANFFNSANPRIDQSLVWLRIEDDNTNMKFSWSKNGFDWMSAKNNYARTTNSLSPNQIGFTINPYDQAVAMRVYSYKEN